MSQSARISRRRLLRGLSVAVALPWLEAMEPRRLLAASLLKPPVRLGFFYVPNGVNLKTWRVADSGPLGDLPPTLESLAPVKDRLLVLSDLAAEHCIGKSAGHEPAGGGFLVGAKCKHSEEPEVAGTSVDQVAARELGLKTPVDSLAMGIDPGHRGDHGYSGTYLSHISWRSKTTPAALELNPRQMFDRLFRGNPPRHPNWSDQTSAEASTKVDSVQSSVLDLVREDTKSLQRQLGFSDKRKLEEYLEGLRAVEKQIEVADRDSSSHHQEALQDAQDEAGFSDLPNLIIPDGRGIPATYSEHVNLMLDIMTLAFQTDNTRVASFMFSYEKSGRAYPEIDASGSHHSTSHHQNKDDALAQLTRINSHHVELFSRMLQRMAAIREGDSTLLDNVVLLYGAGISDGNKHNHDDLPILVAGGGGGTIQGGRHIKYGTKTPLCNLYLEMMARAGVPLKQFGDSTGLLGNLG